MSVSWFGGLDGVTLTVEAALATASGSYAVFDVSKFDSSTFGPDIVWADVSSYVREPLSTQRGFSRDNAAWQPGTATVKLDNTKRYFSASNLSSSSPFVVGGISQIRPVRPLRIRATYAGTTYYLYQGYVKSWQGSFVPGHVDAFVTVPCEDQSARLAKMGGYAQTPVGAGEYAGQRVNRVLDSVGYTGPRNVDLGRNTMQATALSTKAMQELALVADSEGGAVWVDADGTLMFNQQYYLMETTRSTTVQATFGDGSGSELPCNDIVDEAADGDLIQSGASFQRVGGTAQLVVDAASQQVYDNAIETRADLVCETDTQALTLAQFHVEQFKDAEDRIRQIVVKPRTDPEALFPQVLGRRIRDLVRVVVRPLGGGTITQDCHIIGISHEITQDDWTTTFDLASAAVYEKYSDSRFDIGHFDSMRFFF